MTWDTLGYEAGLVNVSARTIQRAMGSLHYYKCVACQKGWVSKDLAKRRLEFAKTMLSRYPNPVDWYRVRFSDEVHFGLGPQGKLMIIRRPGERYCKNCVQETREPDEADKKKLHSWAAIGHGFKSPLVFYEIASNTNGKMTQRAYIDQILEPVVKPWIQRGDDFVLEEDQDSGHGMPGKIKKTNIVTEWKAKNGLESYFNGSHMPEISPIEDCWQPTKQYVRKFPHWDEQDTRELALEGWERIPQDWIDKRIEQIPDRLRKVVEMEGRMIGIDSPLKKH